MLLELIRPGPDDAAVLGRILFSAFKDLYDRHGLPPDFPDPKAGIAVAAALIARRDFHALAARLDGELVGSNFVSYTDPVAAVGPISVQPGVQARGIGRGLMQDVIDHAQAEHGEQIRLVQDGINVVSLSLYTSLGFDVQEPLALLTLTPAEAPDPAVRRATPADLDACDELCQRIYRVSRRGELAGALAQGESWGLVPFVLDRDGEIVACVIPGFLGYGVAESNEDLLTTLRTAIRELPPPAARFLCPSRNADLYRRVLSSGGRAIRTLHLMSMGPYESPTGTWYPSIGY